MSDLNFDPVLRVDGDDPFDTNDEELELDDADGDDWADE